MRWITQLPVGPGTGVPVQVSPVIANAVPTGGVALTVRGALPVFVTVIDCWVEVSPCRTLPKLSEVLLTKISGLGVGAGSTIEKERFAVSVVPTVTLFTLSRPVRGPVQLLLGQRFTLPVQEDSAPRLLFAQPLVERGLDSSQPEEKEVKMLPTETGTLPRFVRVKGALVQAPPLVAVGIVIVPGLRLRATAGPLQTPSTLAATSALLIGTLRGFGCAWAEADCHDQIAAAMNSTERASARWGMRKCFVVCAMLCLHRGVPASPVPPGWPATLGRTCCLSPALPGR